MNYERLLAKSSATPDNPELSETLPGHTANVIQAAESLCSTIGATALESLGLNRLFTVSTLRETLTKAALLHDLGKANTHFQAAVRTPQKKTQALRHEWLSAWLALTSTDFSQWLFADSSNLVRQAVLCAVLGHHLRIGDVAQINAKAGSESTSLTLLLDHPDFRETLEATSRVVGAPGPVLKVLEVEFLVRPLPELRRWIFDFEQEHAEGHNAGGRFTALIKALLISADVAGSAVPRTDYDLAAWTSDVMSRVCNESDLKHIAEHRLNGKTVRTFQSEVARSENRITFVKAGCGTGKTVAAYLWAARKAVGRKLFVCYPTTGTATEGFRDYIEQAGAVKEAELIHSRSSVDIEILLEDATEKALARAQKLESLRAWDAPLTVCTADLVLGLIQNNRRPLFSFPALANGAFVFNEVHQYNESMFGALLRFLGAFAGAPVLVMTATLAQDRLAALAEVARQTGGHLKTVSGPGELERLERYELIGPKRQLPWPDIAATLLKGGKVLWVANTVNRAIDFARQASKLSPLLYHSRFRYVDRVAKHFALMSAFSDKSREPILAVTTQVCEVSLDISADLLVTDLAPIPALIQRMGRLNRRAEPGTPVHISQVHLLEPDSARPYSGDEFDFGIVRKWTDSLIGRRLSQQDLTIAFEQLAGEQSGSYPTHSTWLDGGPFSTQSSLRGVDSTVPVILEEDRNKCVRIGGRPDFAAIARFAIPMTLSPVIKELPGWPRVGYAFVVPEGRMDYSEEEGGRWARE